MIMHDSVRKSMVPNERQKSVSRNTRTKLSNPIKCAVVPFQSVSE